MANDSLSCVLEQTYHLDEPWKMDEISKTFIISVILGSSVTAGGSNGGNSDESDDSSNRLERLDRFTAFDCFDLV